MLRRTLLLLVLVIAGAVAPSALLAQQGGRTTYLYDDNGRLTAVIAPTGEAAIYEYDAAGNIVSISRRLYTTVSILEFTPDSGDAGTQVTIYGTGFSLTASQNTVSFNGAAAQIVSNTATEIVATAPAGVTTGPITVTTPTGAATSSKPFTVSPPPMITEFTPTIGAPGETVVINGTNFASVPEDNQVKFNNVPAVVSSATTDSLETSVPAGAVSGHLSVITPSGTVATDADFFVPPAPYAGADVDSAARMASGESRVFNINEYYHISMAIFDGVAGQRVSVAASNLVNLYQAEVYLYGPDWTQLASTVIWSGNINNFIEPQTLPTNGTYTIVVVPYSGYTGSVTVTLSNVLPDITGSINVDGDPITLPIITPGQNARLTYSSAAWQHLGLRVYDTTIAQCRVSVVTSDGRTISNALVLAGTDRMLDIPLQQTDGTYTVVVDPVGAFTGNLTVALENTPDITDTITINGPTVYQSTFRLNQNVILSFEGTAGQRVSMSAFVQRSNSFIYIYNPDGSLLTGTYLSLSGFTEPETLPATGTYKILVDPEFSSTITVSVSLYEVPPDVTGTIVIDGPEVSIATTTPGQNARLTFSGNAGQRVKFTATSSQFSGYMYFKNPDGTLLGDYVSEPTSGHFISIQTLPVTGTYSIYIDPARFNVGGITATLVQDTTTDATAELVIGGPSVTVTTTVAEQNMLVTFDANAGQRVRLNVRDLVGIYYGYISIYKPDGSSLGERAVLNGDIVTDFNNLPMTGKYTILLDPLSTYTGSITLSAETGNTITTSGGTNVTEYIMTPGQNAQLTFSGTVGQELNFNFYDVTIPNSHMVITAPNGTQVASTTITQPSASGSIHVQSLPATGTYTITIDPGATGTGRMVVSVMGPIFGSF